MGIPSYYKKLIADIPDLIKRHNFKKVSNMYSNSTNPESIQWLFMDFNCLIYHCLYRADTPAYYSDSQGTSLEWERQFLDCIVTYCLKIISQVSPTTGVFIGIDGVVPMAKMRQQRLRRFKSIWLSQQTDTSQSTWDKNSITPGTQFMENLTLKLQDMIKKHSGKNRWILSSSNEPGEGEHKIMHEWSKHSTETYTGNFAVYGLDADLIVLSLLGRERYSLNGSIYLFREETSNGKIAYDSDGEEVFEWFSINILEEWLTRNMTSDNNRRQFILNYCFAMSILGNDFLPSSLGLKIRDDGHSELLEILNMLCANGIHLIDSATLEISFDSILKLFIILSSRESDDIYKYITKKQRMAINRGLITIKGDSNIEGSTTVIGDDNWVLSNIHELALLYNNHKLHNNWDKLYLTKLFSGLQYNNNTINTICMEYLYGIQWTWAYYIGNYSQCCYNWFYPYNLPPLWKWLRNYLEHHKELPIFPNNIAVRADDIKTVEQLVLVLPLESWNLIPECSEKKFCRIAPQFYPDKFTFESIGKRYFWECESLIPIPSILEIKHLIRVNN
jgi:5'-3' exonuclease